MKKGVRGAAIAAAVGVCALVYGTAAEAFVLTFDAAEFGTGGDGTRYASGSVDTVAKTASFSINDYEQTGDYQNFYTLNFSGDAKVTSEILKRSVGPYGSDYFVSFSLDSENGTGSYSSTDGTSYTFNSFTYNFSINQYVDSIGTVTTSFQDDEGATFLVDVSPTSLSIVPLPSSAPLLGSALIALGGIGYASRRRTVTR